MDTQGQQVSWNTRRTLLSAPHLPRHGGVRAFGLYWLASGTVAISHNLDLIHVDQCRLGQYTPKPTTVATNLALLYIIGNNFGVIIRTIRNQSGHHHLL